MMKYIFFLLLAIGLLTSCNKDEGDPEFTPLPIERQFKTETLPVKLSELKDFTEYEDEVFIVNSIDELPDDKHFSVEDFTKANINFSEYSLIIAYQLLFGDITSFSYGWCYNNWFDRYQFNTKLGYVKDSEYEAGEIENLTFIRSAVLVRHIPSDSDCTISLSIYEQ